MTNINKLSGLTLPAGPAYPKLVNCNAPAFPAGAGNLVGCYGLGGDAKLTLCNLATRVSELLALGTPVLATAGQALGATVGNGVGYETPLVGMADVSFLCIAKAMNGAGSAVITMISQYQSGGGTYGDGLGFGTNSFGCIVGAAAGGAFGQSAISMAAANIANWNTFGGRIKATGEAKSFWGHEGLTVAGAESAAVPTRATSARKYRIGTPHTPLSAATDPMLFVAIFNAALTDQNMIDNIAYLRASYGPTMGVTTL